MAKKKNHAQDETRAKPKRKEERRKNNGQNKRHMNITDFLFESAYQVVTWVCIALAIGGFFYFLSKGIGRGVLWSVIALFVFIGLMIGIVADRYFFRDSSKGKERSSYARDQGALMVVESVAGEPLEPVVGQNFRIIVKFINRGHSPAKKVRIVTVADPVVSGESPHLVYSGDPTLRVGTVDPDVEHQVTLFPVTSKSTGEERPLTPELFDAVRTGRIRIFVHGRIDYEDAGKPHWRTFCYFLITPFNEHFGLWTERTNQTDD